MKIVKSPAIKTPSGRVVSAKAGEHHKHIDASGKRGFKLSDGAFVGREAGAKVANAAKQVKPAFTDKKQLHSHMLKGR